jgi:hypothetical protein
LVCCEVSAAAEGWLVEDVEADGWLVEDVEDDGWLVEADGLEDELLVVSVLELMPDVDELDELGELELLEALLGELDCDEETDCPACFDWSSAAWVRGPMMPSIGPGSKPLSFSDCWSCLTDSSPAALPDLALPDDAPLADDVSDEAPVDAEVEAEGEVAEDGGCDDCEAPAALLAGWLSAANTVPAAMSAATSASFFISMEMILSREVRPGRRTQLPCPLRPRISRVASAMERATRSRTEAVTTRCAGRRRSHA